jgi:hypothetical protein
VYLLVDIDLLSAQFDSRCRWNREYAVSKLCVMTHSTIDTRHIRLLGALRHLAYSRNSSITLHCGLIRSLPTCPFLSGALILSRLWSCIRCISVICADLKFHEGRTLLLFRGRLCSRALIWSTQMKEMSHTNVKFHITRCKTLNENRAYFLIVTHSLVGGPRRAACSFRLRTMS